MPLVCFVLTDALCLKVLTDRSPETKFDFRQMSDPFTGNEECDHLNRDGDERSSPSLEFGRLPNVPPHMFPHLNAFR